MHKHRRIRTFLLSSAAVILLSTSAFAQVDAPPVAPEAPIDQPPPPPPPPPPVVEVAPPPPTPPAAVPMHASVAASTAIAPSQSPFKIETPNGNSIKVGLLLQPQYHAVNSPPGSALDSYSHNLFLRRTRILLGGTLFGAIEYFVETDAPNLFLSSNETNATTMVNTQVKGSAAMYIQDAFATAKPFGDVFKIDVGYMLPPLAHNAVQGAGTLLAWDYFANSFLSGNLFGSASNPVGRDAGVQLRGLVLDNHLEYRAGLFQGLRDAQTATDVGARNFFRFAARLQVNLFDPETGFFYAGTYLGAKRVLSLGGSIDIQDSYRYFAGDFFADLPLGPGVFTGQVNVAYWNGHSFIAIPDETAIMAEVGYNIAGVRVSPILRFEDLLVASTATAGSSHVARFGGGVGWWPYGHTSNLKLFFTQIRASNEDHAQNQVNLQWQVYFF
jgi:hypothetical protein